LLVGAGLFYALRVLLKIKRKKIKKETIVVLGEEIAEGTRPDDLASAAIAAAQAGDFRTGVRKLYIALLYRLAEKDLIEMHAHATNREYLARLSRFKPLAAPVAYLTDRFDYVWYGMFPASQQDFAHYLEHYRQAVATAQDLNASQWR
jgi:hypothetical protein